MGIYGPAPNGNPAFRPRGAGAEKTFQDALPCGPEDLLGVPVFNDQGGVKPNPYDGGRAEDIPFGKRYPLTRRPKPVRLPGDAQDGVEIRPKHKTSANKKPYRAEQYRFLHTGALPFRLGNPPGFVKYFCL
jgi:hypothetical protein